MNFSISLSSANEVPSNSSTVTGSGTASYNTSTKVFSMNVTFSGLTAISAHIHNGAVGVSGVPEFTLTPASPINFTTLTSSQENDLLENKYYVNIHSTSYSAGEIRGQIVKQ
ncbi:MAG: CHRD domain-containing protein [Sphingobacteriales bacterium]|nr:CHRD domain-containing protein [Sphingobacteriales bacterium]